jgi:hypothetical protein
MQSYSNSESNTHDLKDPNLLLSLKLKKFPTFLKEYNEFMGDVEYQFNFIKLFPKLFSFIKSFECKFCSKYPNTLISYELNEDLNSLDDHLKKMVESNLSEIEEEFPPFLIEEWNALNVYMNGRTKVHTIICLIFLYYEIEILNKNLNEYDKNVLYWAILLHDIAKHVILNEKLGEKFENKR